MTVPDRSRSEARQAADLAALLLGRGVPRGVPRFYRRAIPMAVRRRDRQALRGSTRAFELTRLLELAGDADLVIEVGTSVGWTTAALALARPTRRVVSVDPKVRRNRADYLALLDPGVRARLELVEGHAEAGPAALGLRELPPAGLIYLDGGHSREATRDAFAAWESVLAPGATVVFHDYGEPLFPGVAQAVAELGLDGRVEGTLFVASAQRVRT